MLDLAAGQLCDVLMGPTSRACSAPLEHATKRMPDASVVLSLIPPVCGLRLLSMAVSPAQRRTLTRRVAASCASRSGTAEPWAGEVRRLTEERIRPRIVCRQEDPRPLPGNRRGTSGILRLTADSDIDTRPHAEDPDMPCRSESTGETLKDGCVPPAATRLQPDTERTLPLGGCDNAPNHAGAGPVRLSPAYPLPRTHS